MIETGQGSHKVRASTPLRVVKTIWSVFSSLLIGVAIGLVIAAAGLVIVPKALGWTSVVILSGSMEPELWTGGIAFIDEVDPRSLKEGDIITYRPFTDQNNMVTHRIVAVTDGPNGLAFQTKGDANSDPDQASVMAN